MKKPFLISCAGLAKSGKNTFCSLLQDELWSRYQLSSCKLSFAFQLRKDVEQFAKQCGFDVWGNKDKEMFRPLLTWYGYIMREKSNGQYFINSVKKKLEELDNNYAVYMLDDLRFSEKPFDELQFCQSMGIVVHVSKYKMVQNNQFGDYDSYGGTTEHMEFDQPPNELEARNDPLLKEAANYKLAWRDSKGDVIKLKPDIIKFCDWLENKSILKENIYV